MTGSELSGGTVSATERQNDELSNTDLIGDLNTLLFLCARLPLPHMWDQTSCFICFAFIGVSPCLSSCLPLPARCFFLHCCSTRCQPAPFSSLSLRVGEEGEVECTVGFCLSSPFPFCCFCRLPVPSPGLSVKA